ncbi:MAG: integron integrase [Proteobacteria bacterium]|nr:integron integrase [Verrucomicrobiota bacterium]NBU11654.1 integron integrase [Pseudomonadota bacterium]
MVSYSISAFKSKSPFIEGLRRKMRERRLSPRTEDAYVHWTAQFFAWTGWARPDAVTGQQVTDFLSHLAAERQVSASTQNQAFNALLFLFRHGLEKEMGEIKATRATRQANVPEILTKDELAALMKHLAGDWLLLTQLGYGTGLRLMELLRLRVKDFDFGNGLITVHDGKGGKNRVVPLPKSMANALKAKLETVRAIHNADLANGFGSVWLPGELAVKYQAARTAFKWQWAFPSREICEDRDGTRRRHHLFPNGFQTALREAAKKAGITKRVSPHILRHSHATALLEMGRSINEVQARLGHCDVRTTMIYLHCVDAKRMPSPMDCLCEH